MSPSMLEAAMTTGSTPQTKAAMPTTTANPIGMAYLAGQRSPTRRKPTTAMGANAIKLNAAKLSMPAPPSLVVQVLRSFHMAECDFRHVVGITQRYSVLPWRQSFDWLTPPPPRSVADDGDGQRRCPVGGARTRPQGRAHARVCARIPGQRRAVGRRTAAPPAVPCRHLRRARRRRLGSAPATGGLPARPTRRGSAVRDRGLHARPTHARAPPPLAFHPCLSRGGPSVAAL